MRTGVPVTLITPIMDEDGIFRIMASDPITMDKHPDKKTAVTQNAEKVLKVAEEYISKVPYQWVMFLPVWPDAISQVP